MWLIRTNTCYGACQWACVIFVGTSCALENIRFLWFPLWCQMVVHTEQDGHLLLFIVQFKQTFQLCLRSAQLQRGKAWPEEMSGRFKRRESDIRKGRWEKKRWTRWMQGSRQGNFPWNAETTAWLPEQFYTPVVSHLSHRPSRSGPPESVLRLHLFGVSVHGCKKPEQGLILG